MDQSVTRRTFARMGAAAAAAAATAVRPNVVIILADDLGWKDAGFMGGNVPTPNIDRIAREGVRFTQLCFLPLCTPSRAALLTGRSPVRYGLIYSVIRPWSGHGVPAEELLLCEVFHRAGYQTAAIGKWHLGHAHTSQLPNARAFDHFYGHMNAEIDYFEHTEQGGLDWQRNGKGLREKGYSTELLGGEAVRWLEARDRSRPFLLYLPFNAVHAPLQAPVEVIRKYEGIANPRRRVLAAVIDVLDQQVGRVLHALDAQNVAQNTLVVFLSDNGGATAQGSDNGIYRAGKLTAYEGGLRVPGAMRWPGQIQPGRAIDDWLTVLDVFPTLCAAAGVRPESGLPLDGQNMWPVITGSGSVLHNDFYVACKHNETSDRQQALRTREWKLVESVNGRDQVVTELFNLGEDPREQNDLAAREPQMREQLQQRLDKWKNLHPQIDIESSMHPHPGWRAPADYAQMAADYPLLKRTDTRRG